MAISRLGLAFRYPSILLFVLLGACSSTSTSANDAGTDSGTTASADGGSTPASGSDASAEDADGGDAVAPTGGLLVSQATNASLDGHYDLVLHRYANGAEVAYNGGFPEASPQIEMEIVTSGGTIKRAHFWNYVAGGGGVEKTYGCDGSTALPCAGITIDDANGRVTLGTTWKEVTPDLTGQTPDQVVAGGGTVTLTGVLSVQ